MKKNRLFFFVALVCLPLYSQNGLDAFDPSVTMKPEQCQDLFKQIWDGYKKLSEEYQENAATKSEFESTAEFNDRVKKLRDQYIAKINKFSSGNKLNEKVFSVWMKAELVKYDADNQVYSVKSPTQVLVQPKKKEIVVQCLSNKFVSISESNKKGYRFANLQLNTEPEFSWFVNTQTAQAAKNKEHLMFFKLWFRIETSVNESDTQIVITIIPTKLGLMDQSENFTYWSEEIR